MRLSLSLILAVLFITIPSFAWSCFWHHTRQGNHHAKIIQSSVRRVLPGRRESPITYEYKYLIVWESNTSPNSIKAYCNNTWMACHFSNKKGQDITDLREIKKGDTLQVVPFVPIAAPITGKRFKPVNNAIYFKTKNTTWFYLPAKKMVKLSDLALP